MDDQIHNPRPNTHAVIFGSLFFGLFPVFFEDRDYRLIRLQAAPRTEAYLGDPTQEGIRGGVPPIRRTCAKCLMIDR